MAMEPHKVLLLDWIDIIDSVDSEFVLTFLSIAKMVISKGLGSKNKSSPNCNRLFFKSGKE